MKKVQQDVMRVLLKTLLDKELITKEIHEKGQEKILGTLDWPEFFCNVEAESKEELHGSA